MKNNQKKIIFFLKKGSSRDLLSCFMQEKFIPKIKVLNLFFFDQKRICRAYSYQSISRNQNKRKIKIKKKGKKNYSLIHKNKIFPILVLMTRIFVWCKIKTIFFHKKKLKKIKIKKNKKIRKNLFRGFFFFKKKGIINSIDWLTTVLWKRWYIKRWLKYANENKKKIQKKKKGMRKKWKNNVSKKNKYYFWKKFIRRKKKKKWIWNNDKYWKRKVVEINKRFKFFLRSSWKRKKRKFLPWAFRNLKRIFKLKLPFWLFTTGGPFFLLNYKERKKKTIKKEKKFKCYLSLLIIFFSIWKCMKLNFRLKRRNWKKAKWSKSFKWAKKEILEKFHIFPKLIRYELQMLNKKRIVELKAIVFSSLLTFCLPKKKFHKKKFHKKNFRRTKPWRKRIFTKPRVAKKLVYMKMKNGKTKILARAKKNLFIHNSLKKSIRNKFFFKQKIHPIVKFFWRKKRRKIKKIQINSILTEFSIFSFSKKPKPKGKKR